MNIHIVCLWRYVCIISFYCTPNKDFTLKPTSVNALCRIPHSLSMRCMVACFQRIHFGKRKNKTKEELYSGEICQIPLSQVIRVNINKSCRFMYPWYDVIRTEVVSAVFQPKTHNPSPIIRNKSDKSQLRDIPQIREQFSSKLPRYQI